MDLGLKDKVAVVLAASAGLGRGVAEVLAEEGCRLALCSRSLERLQPMAQAIRERTGRDVFTQAADVADGVALERFMHAALAHFGRVDILVANAGGPPPGPSDAFTEADYQRAYELTLLSVMRACRVAVPAMRQHKWGRIIMLASTSIKCALENLALSNIFRSAVAGYAKTLALETAAAGIRVNCVMTGPFLTDRMQQLGEAAAQREKITFEQWRERAEKNTLVGRFGRPREMGDLVAFLASERADYLTGACIPLDGGALKTIT